MRYILQQASTSQSPIPFPNRTATGGQMIKCLSFWDTWTTIDFVLVTFLLLGNTIHLWGKSEQDASRMWTWSKLQGECCVLACFLWLAQLSFLYSPGLPALAQLTVSWDLLHQLALKKMPHTYLQKLISSGQFFSWGALFWILTLRSKVCYDRLEKKITDDSDNSL